MTDPTGDALRANAASVRGPAPDAEADADLAQVLAGFTNVIMNERVRAFNEGLDAGRAENARLREAGQLVLDGLNARIDSAPPSAVPVFDGIAELHAALKHGDQ